MYVVPRDNIYAAIDSERDFQDRDDGLLQLTSIAEHILQMQHQLNLASELIGNLYEVDMPPAAAVYANHKKADIMSAIRKVAGLAVACGEIHGMPSREKPCTP